MKSQLILANISRTIARIDSIIVVLLGIPFLLFVGLQLLTGEAANLAVFVSLFLLAGMIAGLVIAWRKEGLGAAITLIAMAGSFFLSGALLPGVGKGQGLSILAGPINLVFALLVQGYSPDVSPSAQLVPVISWTVLTIPVVLFLASWLLRRNSELPSKESVTSKG